MPVNITSDMTTSAYWVNGNHTIKHRWSDWANNELKIKDFPKVFM